MEMHLGIYKFDEGRKRIDMMQFINVNSYRDTKLSKMRQLEIIRAAEHQPVSSSTKTEQKRQTNP
jgi:hypothetical protein